MMRIDSLRTEQNAWFQTRHVTLRVTTLVSAVCFHACVATTSVFIEVIVYQNVGRDPFGGCRDVKELYKIYLYPRSFDTSVQFSTGVFGE